MESTKSIPIVRNICECNYSPGELIEFIDISQKIAISYLKYLEINGRNIRPKQPEGINELQDIAIDCIAGLFKRNDDGEFVQLKRYFGEKINSDKKPVEMKIFSMLRCLIVKKTKQELSRIFKERDPESAKIIRNIRVAVKNGMTFNTFREMGREYIYFNQLETEQIAGVTEERIATITNLDDFLKRDKPVIPEKVLRAQYFDIYNPKDHVSTSIKKMKLFWSIIRLSIMICMVSNVKILESEAAMSMLLTASYGGIVIT